MKSTRSLKNILLALGLAALSSALVSCGSGVQSGDLQTKFGGITTATAISPTAVRLNWKKDSRVSEYQIFEAASSTALQKTVFDSILIENLEPDRSYTFKVVGTQEGSLVGTEKSLTVHTWARFVGVKEVTSSSQDTMTVNWEYSETPQSYLVFVSVDTAPTATTTDNWTKPTATVQSKSYLITGVLPSKTYYVIVHAQYRTEESEKSMKTVSLKSGTTFQTPHYDLSRISIGSLPFIAIDPVPDTAHVRSGFRSQAYWNGNPVSDPLTGSGNLVFSSTAGLPIGQINNISLKFEYGSGAALESKTVDGLTTYIKGMPSHVELPQTTTLPQGASYFGKILAHGDFNCDGGQDLVVGAPDISLAQYGVSKPRAGAVYIYYSKKVGDRYVLQTDKLPSQNPAVPGTDPQIITMDDFQSNMTFGAALAAGNINGDRLGAYSCDDLLVGAPGYVNNGAPTGAAFLFFGSNRGIRATTHMKDMPVNTESCDGRVEGASCVGVILRPDTTLVPPALTGGTTYSPYGGAEFAGLNYWNFGASVAFIGDFDANGYQDIAIGAPNAPWAGKITNYFNNDGYLPQVGSVSIFPGSKFGLGFAQVNGQNVRTVTIFPPIPEIGMRFGASIAGGADVDGRNKIRLADGSLVGGADMIIGAPGFPYSDYVNLNTLKSSIGTTASASIISPAGGGWAVGGVSLSASTNYYGWPQGSSSVGAAFLYYGYSRTSAAGTTDYDNPSDRTAWWSCGSRGMTASTHWSCLANQSSYTILFPRDASSRNFGSAVALVGDPSRFKDNTNETIEPRTSSDPLVPYQYYSDPNGDGYADVIVAASNSSVSGKSTVGSFWTFFGNSNRLFSGADLYNVKSPTPPAPADDYRLNDPTCANFNGISARAACAPTLINSSSLAAGSRLGATQAAIDVADVSGDGLKDIVIGTPGEATVGNSSGAVLVFPSSRGRGITSSYKKLYAQQTSASDQLGTSVTAGNFNGDFTAYQPDIAVTPTIRPYADVFGGAPYDGSQAPSIGTVVGWISSEFPLPSIMTTSSDGNGSPFLLKETQASFTNYGAGDVTIVGDLNGDGYDDGISKITSYASDGSLVVDVVVVFGSPYGLITKDFCLNNPSLIFKGTAPTSACYPSISPVLGLTKDDVSLPQKVPHPANLPGNWMEKAVRAGDVNGDGYDDVIFLSSLSNSSTGLITIFFGARGGLQNTVDPTLTPSVGDPQLVTRAIGLTTNGTLQSGNTDDLNGFIQRNQVMSGDFNGDGYADIAIGVPQAPSPYMNNVPGGPTNLRPGDSGVASGAGWNCGVATTDSGCSLGAPVDGHGMIWVLYGSSRGYQTPAIQGVTTTDMTIGGVGTLDMLDTENPSATKPCTPVTGDASSCQVGYMRNPVWENIAFGYSRLNHNFGATITPMKVNKDQYDDLLVGAPYYTDISCYSKSNPPISYGRVYILYGSDGGLVASARDDYYRWERTGLACPVEASADPLVGDPALGLRSDASKLRAITPTIKNTSRPRNLSYRNFGLYVANVGDVNGDGFEDFVVSDTLEEVPTGSSTWASNGVSYIYYGPLCPMDNDPNINDWFQGDALSGGQVNLNRQTYVSGSEPAGTSFQDIYLGSYAAPGVTASCVRSSTQGIKPVPMKFMVLGASGKDQFGYSMSSARIRKGDFNGDGYDDFLIGSYQSDDTINNVTSKGMGVVFFGSDKGLSVSEYPTVSLSPGSNGLLRPLYIIPRIGTNGSQFFKGNVTVGDVNKDSTADYMVTSRFYDGTGTTRGIWIGTFFIYY